MDFINYLLSNFEKKEVIDIMALYISRATFTDEPEHVFKAIGMLEDLYKSEMETVR